MKVFLSDLRWTLRTYGLRQYLKDVRWLMSHPRRNYSLWTALQDAALPF